MEICTLWQSWTWQSSRKNEKYCGFGGNIQKVFWWEREIPVHCRIRKFPSLSFWLHSMAMGLKISSFSSFGKEINFRESPCKAYQAQILMISEAPLNRKSLQDFQNILVRSFLFIFSGQLSVKIFSRASHRMAKKSKHFFFLFSLSLTSFSGFFLPLGLSSSFISLLLLCPWP